MCVPRQKCTPNFIALHLHQKTCAPKNFGATTKFPVLDENDMLKGFDLPGGCSTVKDRLPNLPELLTRDDHKKRGV